MVQLVQTGNNGMMTGNDGSHLVKLLEPLAQQKVT